MAVKRKNHDASPGPAQLVISQSDAEEKLNARIRKGKDLCARNVATAVNFVETQHDYYKWDEYNYDLLLRMFSNDSVATEYRGIVFGGGSDQDFSEKVQQLHDDIEYKIRRLESILERLELFPIVEHTGSSKSTREISAAAGKVFLVHGHDDQARETVARFMERLGLDVVILHEQPNAGRTILEKFESHSEVAFAVVLLTPDDVGASKHRTDVLNSRARQNVIFELGFFFGRLGRERVCALYEENVELPSDILGLVYVPLDGNNGWHLSLAKELRQAGLPVDLNRVL